MPFRQSDRMMPASSPEPDLFVGCDPGPGTTLPQREMSGTVFG
jgi:hypothetical protein